METKQSKRSSRDGGRFSKYWKVWNANNLEDLILPNTGCVIHHKDGNPYNNEIQNLQKMTDTEHKKWHTNGGRHPFQGKKFSEETRKKQSESHIGCIPWNKGVTGVYSEETKKSMGRLGCASSYGMLGKKHTEATKQKMRGRIPWNKGLKKESK